jgi:hypothetical protein
MAGAFDRPRKTEDIYTRMVEGVKAKPPSLGRLEGPKAPSNKLGPLEFMPVAVAASRQFRTLPCEDVENPASAQAAQKGPDARRQA